MRDKKIFKIYLSFRSLYCIVVCSFRSLKVKLREALYYCLPDSTNGVLAGGNGEECKACYHIITTLGMR
jgi:hypothetical protein